MPFQKGQGGRKRGSGNKAKGEVQALARQLFDPKYWKSLKKRLDANKLHPAIHKQLLGYAFGMPTQMVRVDGEVDVLDKRKALANLPDEVVRDMVARAAFEDESDDDAVKH